MKRLLIILPILLITFNPLTTYGQDAYEFMGPDKAEKKTAKMLALGLIKDFQGDSKVYVNPRLWRSLDNYKLKRNFCRVVSSQITHDRGYQYLIEINVYNYRTGRLIATWDYYDGYQAQ